VTGISRDSSTQTESLEFRFGIIRAAPSDVANPVGFGTEFWDA